MSVITYTRAKIDALLALKASLPGAFHAYAPITSGVDANAPLTFTTSQETVARALGWLIITDPQWGGVIGTDCTTAMQAATRYLDKYDITTHAYTGSGGRGGTVWFPPGGGSYLLAACLVISARIRLRGAGGGRFGGVSSSIAAVSSGGDFTNTDYYLDPTFGVLGIEPGASWLIRLSRNNPAHPEWFHGGQVVGLDIDLNDREIGGITGLQAGELSVIDDVCVHDSAPTSRTVTATFNGTSTVTITGGTFDELEDFRARVTCPSFPSYSAFSRSDAVTTTDSPVITFAAGVTSALVGAEVTAGTTGFPFTSYVVSTSGTTQITMDRKFPSTQAAGSSKSITLDRPRDFRIDQIDSTTSAQFARPVPFTGTATMTIFRGHPGIRMYDWTAIGHIGSVNVSGNSGAGMEFVGHCNRIDALSGDNNGGPLLRFHAAATSGNPASCSIGTLKIENNNYGDATVVQYANYGRHEPAIALTKCGMLDVHIEGGNIYAGDRGSRALIRIQQSTAWQSGYPSLTVDGVEATNPYNVGFDYLVYDRDNAVGIEGGDIFVPTYGGRFYPSVKWNKDNVTYGDVKVEQVPATALGGDVYIRGVKTVPGRPPAYQWQWDTPPDVETLGAWNGNSTAGQFHRYGFGWPTGGDTNTDRQWRWAVQVLPGTTKLWLAYGKRLDFGVQTWDLSVDGGVTFTSLGTLDAYSSAASIDQSSSFRGYIGSGLAITKPAQAILRVRNLTKNASSSGYYWGLSIVRFWTV